VSRWYKQSNSLAKSLGIKTYDDIYKEIQRYEKQLKQDGKWNEILERRKKYGPEPARAVLRQTIEEYKGMGLNDTFRSHEIIEYLGKSKTGGDWYEIPALRDRDNKSADSLRKIQMWAKAVNELYCGGGWCISQEGPATLNKIKSGQSFMVLRRDKKPTIAITYYEGGGIDEVKGTHNQFENISGLDVIDLKHAPKFSFSEIIRNMQSVQEEEAINMGDNLDPSDVISIHDLHEKIVTMTDRELQGTGIPEDELKKMFMGVRSGLRRKISSYSAASMFAELVSKTIELEDGEHQIAAENLLPTMIRAFREKHSGSINDIMQQIPRVYDIVGKEEKTAEAIRKVTGYTIEDFIRFANDSINGKTNKHPMRLIAERGQYEAVFGNLPEGIMPSLHEILSDPKFILERQYENYGSARMRESLSDYNATKTLVNNAINQVKGDPNRFRPAINSITSFVGSMLGSPTDGWRRHLFDETVETISKLAVEDLVNTSQTRGYTKDDPEFTKLVGDYVNRFAGVYTVRKLILDLTGVKEGSWANGMNPILDASRSRCWYK